MKKITPYLTLLFLLLAGTVMAQRPNQNIDPEKLQAARIAFITSRIDLKPEQAERFWPIFNKYTEQREASMKSISQLNRGSDAITEDEAKTRIQKRLQLQQKLIDEEKTIKNFICKKAKIILNAQSEQEIFKKIVSNVQ